MSEARLTGMALQNLGDRPFRALDAIHIKGGPQGRWPLDQEFLSFAVRQLKGHHEVDLAVALVYADDRAGASGLWENLGHTSFKLVDASKKK